MCISQLDEFINLYSLSLSRSWFFFFFWFVLGHPRIIKTITRWICRIQKKGRIKNPNIDIWDRKFWHMAFTFEPGIGNSFCYRLRNKRCQWWRPSVLTPALIHHQWIDVHIDDAIRCSSSVCHALIHPHLMGFITTECTVICVCTYFTKMWDDSCWLDTLTI